MSEPRGVISQPQLRLATALGLEAPILAEPLSPPLSLSASCFLTCVGRVSDYIE